MKNLLENSLPSQKNVWKHEIKEKEWSICNEGEKKKFWREMVTDR
jgi:hypothetical protein